jgi:ABC-2 type transport system permease protein
MTLVVLLTGLVSVNFVHGNGELLLYPAAILFGGMVLGILTATLAASIGVIVSLRSPTVRQAAQKLAFVSLALTWLPMLGFNLLPSNFQTTFLKSATSVNVTQLFFISVVFLVLLNAGLLSLAMARFKRSRLILD